MSEIAEFLLARIAETEEAARAASPSPWSYPGIQSVAGGALYDATRRIVDVVYEQPEDHDGTIVRHILAPEADANGAHIARHDPARVLAECEAKLEVIRLLIDYYCPYAGDDPDETLAVFAAPYADHPDYREEWRPS